MRVVQVVGTCTNRCLVFEMLRTSTAPNIQNTRLNYGYGGVMNSTLRIEKSHKTNEEPKYKVIQDDGGSDADGMGIQKLMDRKSDAIVRLRQLGVTEAQIERAFRELETSDHTEI